MSDFPFNDVITTAEKQTARGRKVFQKWTCEHCGARQTMDTPDVFYKTGKCEECKKITNIEKRGCNLMVMIDRPTGADMADLIKGGT